MELLKASVLLALSLHTTVYANPFDELDSQFTHNAASEAAEFAQWQQQQDAEYAAYKQRYLAALKDYENTILQHWDKAETTDKTNWVDYSDGYKTKRVVDFENNEIRISSADSGLSLEAFKALVATNLQQTLSETPNSARANDPVLQAAGRTQTHSDTISKQRILSEVSGANISALVSSATIRQQHQQPLLAIIKLPPNSPQKRAVKYKGMVDQYAASNRLNSTLVYAIMHTESAFNPMARSHIPAYGLMQIVPESAGRDVAKRLTGKEKVYSAHYLYQPNNNVQAGATYLNILYYSYLKGIRDPQSRLYCTIAAYNTGAGNVAKTFVGKNSVNAALPIINNMSAEAVYKKLMRSLPHEETRNYLRRVTKRQGLYEGI